MTAPNAAAEKQRTQPSQRPYQTAGLESLKASLRGGCSRIVYAAPTGSGKTVSAAAIVKGALAKRKRIAFTVPFVILIDQTFARLVENGADPGDMGVMQADHPLRRPAAPVQICSVQTLARRAFPQVDIVIVDEAHVRHAPIASWMKLRPELIFIGLTATPWTAGMGDTWDDLVNTTSIAELQAQGFLCRSRVFAPSHPDLADIKITAGDYDEGQLSERMSGKKIVADVVANWRENGEDRQTLCYAVDRAHAATLHDEFESACIRTAYIDGNTDRAERAEILARFSSGEIKIICSVNTLCQGIDLPDVACIILARPTKSEILYVQIIGRGLRTAPGKTDCFIFDHSDTTLQLGFVEDIRHEKLRTAKDDRARKQRSQPERTPAKPRQCISCTYLIAPGAIRCDHCGRPNHRPSSVTVKDGELAEIGAVQAKQARHAIEQREFLAQLKGFAIERNYAAGWAAHKYRARFGEWPPTHIAVSTPPTPCSGTTRAWIRGQTIRFAYAQRAQKGASR
jgi:DNA repair protein RadD